MNVANYIFANALSYVKIIIALNLQRASDADIWWLLLCSYAVRGHKGWR